MVNGGQLVRQEFGAGKVYAIGSGTYQGTVIASPAWGAPITTMSVPRAVPGSWESLLHAMGARDKILLSPELQDNALLAKPIGHRAIGVVYDPSSEAGNYMPSTIPKRYDAFLFIDRTTALHPLGTAARNEPPDTYPSGY
ncbi:MAG: protein-L-isoaspartate O-methyltransferase [Flaviaesturariibacter sp.]|nr:protein-L-isoaspartate O-methyltransferase [Flaviaesturariibacter sp.]